jgi:hypothetical protein
MSTLNSGSSVDLTPTSNTSLLTTTNLLQPTGFRMVINRKNFPNLQFFCNSFTHPDVSVNAAELAYRRITSVPFAGDKFTFGELSAQILLDEEMNSYEEMYNWMERVVETNETRPSGRPGEPIDYGTLPPTYADVTLTILNSSNNKSREIRYIDCVPTSLGSINFETVAGDQFLTYTVGFRYTYFEIR